MRGWNGGFDDAEAAGEDVICWVLCPWCGIEAFCAVDWWDAVDVGLWCYVEDSLDGIGWEEGIGYRVAVHVCEACGYFSRPLVDGLISRRRRRRLRQCQERPELVRNQTRA